MSQTRTRKRKSTLGRGLDSLIGEVVSMEAPIATASEAGVATAAPALLTPHSTRPDAGKDWLSDGQTTPGSTMLQIPTTDIAPSPFQPRRSFTDADLASLAESITRSGVMQPIIVRRVGDGVSGEEFELVAGERRWRAAMQAGLKSVPAIERSLTDEQSAEMALVENVQRRDLGPMERAWGFRSLAERFGLSHAQVAQRVGLDRSTVTNLVRLTELEREIQELLEQGRLSVGHGKALLSLTPGAGRLALAARAAKERWSVRRLEQSQTLPRGGGGGDQAAPASRARLEKQLGEHLGTKVSVRANMAGTKGRLVIEFYSLDHFDGLMSRMGFELR
ncbi:MAG: ParB/RepB/Spo0J family partition protein [Planctomycetes bacterium]|nr:ParB/RepB/Spo0J family partition protein [Planctomycetota bacterium]